MVGYFSVGCPHCHPYTRYDTDEISYDRGTQAQTYTKNVINADRDVLHKKKIVLQYTVT